ncbi:MAG: hypothetical protein LBU32_20525 [Clostridiales bacterium]|nr:hypothetical protein [Clostridiales bacterium]
MIWLEVSLDGEADVLFEGWLSSFDDGNPEFEELKPGELEGGNSVKLRCAASCGAARTIAEGV